MAIKTHVPLRDSRRGADHAAVRIRDVDPKEQVRLTICIRGPRLPGPGEYIGRNLSSKVFAERFGAAKADAERVIRSLQEHGLQQKEISLMTRSICVTGTAAAVQRCFRVHLSVMRSARGGEYRGRDQHRIMIPRELKGIITGVFGLDQRRMAERGPLAEVAADRGAANPGFTPDAIEKHYSFPPGDGAGQNIAIAEFSGVYSKPDGLAYCKKFNRPTPKLNLIVDVRTNPIAKAVMANNGLPNREVMLDTEIVTGLCPKANISVYFMNNEQRGWIDLLRKVIKAKPRPVVLSISWGEVEGSAGWSKNAIKAINRYLNSARLLGITVCAASGDNGIGGSSTPGTAPDVLFPASSPHVLAVGGTMVNNSGKTSSEVVWWESPGFKGSDSEPTGGCSTGGGVSGVCPRPSWQNVHVTSLNVRKFDGRVVPDVAALAGPPGYYIVYQGEAVQGGGTSGATPLWAALIARINAKLPQAKQQLFLTPLLYKMGQNGKSIGASASSDITVGNNRIVAYPSSKISAIPGYSAGPGFDAVSGWGVPIGEKLLKGLLSI